MNAATDRPVIGYIGLGDMGAAMALNLIDKGWPLALYARRAATLDPFRGTAAMLLDSPAAVGGACAILCLCVVDADQIEDVLFGADGAAAAMAPGSIVIIHSTVSPESCRAIGARLAEGGIALIDAPVTGAAERGRAGTLTIAVGGAPDDVPRALPLLEAEGTHVAHLGPVGSGQIAKLLNNGLFIIQLSLVDEMKRLGAAMGHDPKKVLEVIDTGTASSWASGFHSRSGRDGQDVFSAYETTYPGGVIEIVRKDIRLFGEELTAHGLADSRMAKLAAGAVDAMPRVGDAG